MNDQLTFATVVFEAELVLLELQARSLAMHLDPDCVAQIIVLDNTALGIRRKQMQSLRRAYGGLSHCVTFIRVPTLANMRGVSGWRSQQVAKLVVSRQLSTKKYVVLDAKNHLVRAANFHTFVNDDGRVHVGLHPYEGHPLRDSLATTISFLGGSDEDVSNCLERFPITATPFVFHTDLVGQCIAFVEERTGEPFAAAFEAAKLLEFFAYSGWVKLHGPGLDAVFDGVPIESPTVWPKKGTTDGLAQTIKESTELQAPFFAVHRQVLARADEDLQNALARWWTSCGLCDSHAEGLKLLRRFRRAYGPGMVIARVNERLGRLRANRS